MFKHRSHKKELLDQHGIPERDLFRNLMELDVINHYLGGYSITYSALSTILKAGKSYVLVDIGSGGGDTLKRIQAWSKNTAFSFNLFGVDIKPSCISYSLTHRPVAGINFICDDYRNILNHLPRVDIIHASLFCHHLTEGELIALIRFSVTAKATLVINDLERNPVAYHAIKLLTRLFSRSYLVKNDAPLSVLRGFKKAEWLDILQKSGVKNYSVKNKWAFRHLVIVYADK
ncbi:MAG TPA: SAM-dependent methyltransferase [Bacteroidia bacterium]|nr:SAM-dependent methyltransferase [Bacteroidia bacterium]